MTRYEIPIDEKRRFIVPLNVRQMLQSKDPDNWRIQHMVIDEGSLILYDDKVWQDRGVLFYEDADTPEKQESIDAILRTEHESEIKHQYKITIPMNFFKALNLKIGGSVVMYDSNKFLELANPKDAPAYHVKTPEESGRMWRGAV